MNVVFSKELLKLPSEKLEEIKKRAWHKACALGSQKYMTPERVEICVKDNKIVQKTFYGPDSIKRVRRITGYFADISQFNQAKYAELLDRKANM